jgi:hypothetical protein
MSALAPRSFCEGVWRALMTVPTALATATIMPTLELTWDALREATGAHVLPARRGWGAACAEGQQPTGASAVCGPAGRAMRQRVPLDARSMIERGFIHGNSLPYLYITLTLAPALTLTRVAATIGLPTPTLTRELLTLALTPARTLTLTLTLSLSLSFSLTLP